MSEIVCAQLHNELLGRRHSTLQPHGLFALAKHLLISDIWAVWRSGLSVRVPECQKLKMVGYALMAKCNILKKLGFQGLSKYV